MELKQLISSFYGKKNNPTKLQVKYEDCVLWVKHAPCLKVCFDEASPAKKRSTHFCEAITLSCCLLSSCLTLSRWPSHARCLSRGLHSGTGFFVACGTAPTRRGKAKLAAVAKGAQLPLQSFPPHALPQLACPLAFPGEGDSLLPFLFPGAGQSLLPTVFYHPKMLWHSSCDRNGAGESWRQVGTVPPWSGLAQAWP